MADLFTDMQKGLIGPGGLKCPCCNIFSKKRKSKHFKGALSQIKRSKLKRLTKKLILEDE